MQNDSTTAIAAKDIQTVLTLSNHTFEAFDFAQAAPLVSQVPVTDKKAANEKKNEHKPHAKKEEGKKQDVH